MFRLILAFWRAVFALLWRRLRGWKNPHDTWVLAVLVEILRRSIDAVCDQPPPRVRRLFHPAPIHPRLKSRVEVWEDEIAGVRTQRIRPREDATGPRSDRPTLLYFHGGGYVLLKPETHQVPLARLAVLSGADVVSVDYRLAPEHPFPAAIDDAVNVYRMLLATGVRPDRLWIGGDSAGGGLSLAAMLRLRDRGERLPRGAVLISPWVDLTLSGESVTSNAPYDYLTRGALASFAEHYLDGTPADDPAASPIFAHLGGLPPLYVVAGGRELLRSEAERLVERVRAARGTATLNLYPRDVHAFPCFEGVIPSARAALKDIAAFLRPSS